MEGLDVLKLMEKNKEVYMKKYFFALFSVFILFSLSSCTKATSKTQVSKKKEGVSKKVEKIPCKCFGKLYKGVNYVEKETPDNELLPSEKERKRIAEKQDKYGLMYSSKVVTDKDKSMLIPPEHIKKFVGKDIIIAKEAPEIDFAIVPERPFFFSAPVVKSKSKIPNTTGPWSNWSQANYYPKTGKFYSSVGDHGKYNAHIYIVEYDPALKKIKVSTNINKILGRKKTQFAEGKIHGWLNFYPPGSPNLWFCTYWAKYPEPDEEDYATGYKGGHIMYYNVETGDVADFGVPLERASWPYHRVDTKRGILYAVGMFSEFLAWDINKQKVKWAGYLPAGMKWWVRAILIDDKTGMVYTTNMDPSDPQKHFIKYDPYKNRFYKLKCHPPKNINPVKRGNTGGYNHMRAQTAKRGPNGLFYGVTITGELFTFNPDKEEVKYLGINWPGNERYTTSMARSPKGRYVYYLPGAHGHAYLDGAPVMQYDTKTGKKKVLAFLHPYYYNKYGYIIGGTFSIKLDDKGENLFVMWNGVFDTLEHRKSLDRPDAFGQNSVMLIRIPASERVE